MSTKGEVKQKKGKTLIAYYWIFHSSGELLRDEIQSERSSGYYALAIHFLKKSDFSGW